MKLRSIILIGAAVFATASLTTFAEYKKASDAEIKVSAEQLKFSLTDKETDKDQPIRTIRTVFATNDDNKDKNDGISEKYSRGNEILGRNTSWGKDLEFHDHNTDYGQEFDISAFKIPAKDVNGIVYSWSMDNDDGWNVQMTVYIKLANGHEYQVGGHYWNIHGGAKDGSIGLAW